MKPFEKDVIRKVIKFFFTQIWAGRDPFLHQLIFFLDRLKKKFKRLRLWKIQWKVGKTHNFNWFVTNQNLISLMRNLIDFLYKELRISGFNWRKPIHSQILTYNLWYKFANVLRTVSCRKGQNSFDPSLKSDYVVGVFLFNRNGCLAD